LILTPVRALEYSPIHFDIIGYTKVDPAPFNCITESDEEALFEHEAKHIPLTSAIRSAALFICSP